MSEVLTHNPGVSDSGIFRLKKNIKAPLLWQDVVKRGEERTHNRSQMNILWQFSEHY